MSKQDRASSLYDVDRCDLLRHGREYLRELCIGQQQMALTDLRQHGAVVSRDRKVAAVVQLTIVESGPVAMHLATGDVAAHQPHDIAMAMIGSSVAILG